MARQITTEQAGRVVVARLDNPPHALMTAQMVAELDDLVSSVDKDDSVGAVVLTGAHPDRFLAHYDVGELLASAKASPSLTKAQAGVALKVAARTSAVPGGERLLGHTPAGGLVDLQRFHNVLLRMGRSGVVYIAAINKSTAGGGMELALACDLRFVTEGGELAQPEILLGFPPGGGGTQRMARLIGRAAALEIMLSGRPVSAEEALQIGLVTGVFPEDEFLENVLDVAARMATRFKPAVAVIKNAVLEGASDKLEAGLQNEKSGLISMFGEERVRASMQAYVDHLDRTGELPAVDPEARERLQDGSFSPFYPDR
ncbi:enoyl-CoA hydratase/isomerase family protein [Nocardioides humilatus]|uniref:Enoyl-CoA hydratase/isomerase family protein n=1 Tax=Nocardioides humilatus TaxID=2607660 RepID=A0A5B1LLC8_9ACTN|nr:enoyl-CoA hydratase/isomerase family protein [Nocardioides humilatus]KAA1420938.1 enoyl-CoA hydratase/isomerase family protein [Nocardioides humilatus]